MRKGDLIWTGILICVYLGLVFKTGRAIYTGFESSHPYISGFIKYMVLSFDGRASLLQTGK